MCGFYGTTLRYSNEAYTKKLELMNFRGPDFQAVKDYVTKNGTHVTLGHVRLAIMDLDSRSNQPFDYNNDISISFNGEIYNYKELTSLYLKDCNLRTTCDTEVICAMYEKYGTRAVNYLNGMFSFIIYDKRKNIIWGARDRLGKKPFYYWHSTKGIEFASQLSPIASGNTFHIDETARQLYLLHSYIPDPYCIYKEVKKLRAGCHFTYDISTNKIDIQPYWDIFSNTCGFSKPKTYNEAKEVVKNILFDSVKIRLNADVPVGMFLSGGIDSSLVSAVVSKLNKNITAYTIGFKDAKYNESDHAVEVAKALGIPIKVNFCEGDDMLRMFKDYVHYYDEPFADFSLIPSSLVAEKARKDVTVVLGGDGGDELFFGYPKYLKLRYLELFYCIPLPVRKLLAKSLHPFFDEYELRKLVYKTTAEAYRGTGTYCHYYGAENYDSSVICEKIPDANYINNQRGMLKYSDYDIKMYMNSCINTKTDRATMRSSLELRSPIMDYRLAEYSRLLPLEYMYNKDLGAKRILKDILYEMVPRNILERPKKGFGAPLNRWFRGDLHDMVEHTVTRENISKLFPDLNSEVVNNFLYKLMQGGKYDPKSVWTIMTYVLWYNKIIKLKQ